MNSRTRWLLPTGIQEVLPNDAVILENQRRKLLDLFRSWGYRLVIPPFIEFVDSLLLKDSDDLNIQTFKFTDQMSGRTLGVRADMTPQVARIDAHMLKEEGASRLCYCGTVLLTQAESAGGTRSPLQIGAELYGDASIESDVEVIRMMLTAITETGIDSPLLDLGHAGIFDILCAGIELTGDAKQELFSILQRKSAPDMQTFLDALDCNSTQKTAIAAMNQLHGNAEVLQQAKSLLAVAGPSMSRAINKLEALAEKLGKRLSTQQLHFDLAEVRGYHYQNDLVFAAYDRSSGAELARGGRYDNIGEAFGRARPATGFSADLKQLLKLSRLESDSQTAIFAPLSDDPALDQLITELRNSGETIIAGLSSSDTAQSSACNRQLQQNGDIWAIKEA
tara:strand:- start:2254 stop:3432 length:1179 start_codon:yes stop_codon:yes gene_type:complete